MARKTNVSAAAGVLAAGLLVSGCAAGDPADEEREPALRLALGEGGGCPPLARLGPGVLSTTRDEGRLSLTPDGQTAYFHVVDERQVLTIMESRRLGDGWSPPVVAAFSGQYDDLDPFVSADGQQLWFSSFRPAAGGAPRPDADLWRVTREGAGWSAPVNLGAPVNTPYHELFPSTSGDGTLFFNSNRAAPDPAIWDRWDIYAADLRGGGYREAERLPGGVNTEAYWEFNPLPALDGRVLLFASLGRPDGLGDADLYASVRWRGRWQPARNLGPCVNSAAGEYHPSLSPARRSLIFVRFSADPPTGGDFLELGPSPDDGG